MKLFFINVAHEGVMTLDDLSVPADLIFSTGDDGSWNVGAMLENVTLGKGLQIDFGEGWFCPLQTLFNLLFSNPERQETIINSIISRIVNIQLAK